MKTTKMSYVASLWQRYAVCILALLFIALSPAYASQPTAGVSFAQISFTDAKAPQKYSHYGQVSIDYTMLYGEGYINVERYENGKAADWVVKNLPVISGSVLPGYSTMFDLGASGYQSSFSAYVDFSATPLVDDTPLKGKAPVTYRLAKAEYPLQAPDPLPQLYRVKLLKDECQDTDFLITFNDLQPQTYTTEGIADTICIDNESKDKDMNQLRWTGLTFQHDGAGKRIVRGEVFAYFQRATSKPPDGVDFNGVGSVNRRGIPFGTKVRVKFISDVGINIIITPR